MKNSLIEVTKNCNNTTEEDDLSSITRLTDQSSKESTAVLSNDLKSDLNADQAASLDDSPINLANDLTKNEDKDFIDQLERKESAESNDKVSINQIIDEVISQNLLIDTNENSSINATSNTSINATINTVIRNFTAGDSPGKPALVSNQKNLLRKRSTLKKHKLISPGKKYLFSSPSKLKRNLCRSLNKKALCNRKSTSTTKAKRKTKSSDENLKDDLELNYKDKFKKRLKLDNDLISKLKDVEKDLLNESSQNCKLIKSTKKQCKSDKSLSDQVTNVFNDKREDFLNQLICYRKLDDAKEDLISNCIYNQLDDLDIKKPNFLDDHLIDEQLKDKLDLDNLINSLIDKLDDDSSADLKADQQSNQIRSNDHTESSSITNQFISNQIICSNFINHSSSFDTMVSNKNLSTVNSSNHHKDNDKHPLNCKSSTKTNGHSNGHQSESQQLNAFSSSKTKLKTKLAKKTKDTKRKAKSYLDFHLEFDEDTIKKESNDSVDPSINASINAAINSVINNFTVNEDSFDEHSPVDDSPFKSSTKSTKNKTSKPFNLQTCIKNELRKKLLQKSIKLSKNKNGTKGSLTTNGGLTNGKKKTTPTKLNGKTDKPTKVKKKDKSGSPNGKQNDKKVSKKDDKTSKKPRTPHLTKSKLKKQTNKQINGKRKYVKKGLLKKSELLIRNLYKFRQYLKIKKQELLDLDQDELSTFNLVSKDYLMSCFIDSNNFEIDLDIYDPLTISGLMSTQPFSGTTSSKSLLSNELLNDILNNLNDDNASNTNNGHKMDFDEPYITSTEEDDLSSHSDSSFKGTLVSESDLNDDDVSDSEDSESSNSDESDSSDDESSDESDDESEDESIYSDESWTSAADVMDA